MKLFLNILSLFLSFEIYSQLDSIVWIENYQKEIGKNEIWNADLLGNLIITKKNSIEKYDSSGILKFSQSIRSIGKVKQIEPVNAMKTFVFSETQQSLCVLDNTLTLREKCLDLSEYEIDLATHISASGQSDRVWILDQLNSRLLALNLGATGSHQEIKNLAGILDINSVSQIEEFNNALYLLDDNKGIYHFDLYGSLIEFYPLEKCDQIFVSDNGIILALCSGQMSYMSPESKKWNKFNIPLKDVLEFTRSGNTFFFRTENKVINYRLSLAE